MTAKQILLSTVFMLAGTIVLVVGSFSLRRTLRFLKTCRRSPGTVIRAIRGGHRGSCKDSHNVVWAVTLEFSDEQGVIRHGTVQLQHQPREGQLIPLLYDPESPQFTSEVRLDCFQELWFVPGLCLVLGLATLLVGASVLFFNIPVR